MPRGFADDGCVWKINKSLYGIKQAPRNYFLFHKAKLEKIDFRQVESDPCLFICADATCLNYVDDLIFFKNKQAWDNLKVKMQKEKLLFREEESVAGYLGIHVDCRPDGSIHLI